MPRIIQKTVGVPDPVVEIQRDVINPKGVVKNDPFPMCIINEKRKIIRGFK